MGLQEKIRSSLTLSSQVAIKSLSEWLSLLTGPSDPPFRIRADFTQEWGRLFRLIPVVVPMMATVLGVDLHQGKSALQNPQFLWLLIAGALTAVLYAVLSAPLFRMHTSLYQLFFVFLLLGVPWLPLVAAVWII